MKITQRMNYFIDLLMSVSFLACAITGIIKFPGLLKFLHIRARQLPMPAITFIHDWSGIVMSFLVLLYIVFHWKWTVNMTKSFFKKKGKFRNKTMRSKNMIFNYSGIIILLIIVAGCTPLELYHTESDKNNNSDNGSSSGSASSEKSLEINLNINVREKLGVYIWVTDNDAAT